MPQATLDSVSVLDLDMQQVHDTVEDEKDADSELGALVEVLSK